MEKKREGQVHGRLLSMKPVESLLAARVGVGWGEGRGGGVSQAVTIMVTIVQL